MRVGDFGQDFHGLFFFFFFFFFEIDFIVLSVCYQTYNESYVHALEGTHHRIYE